MSIVSAAGFAVTAAMLAVMLREQRKEFASLLALGACVLLLLFGLERLAPSFQMLAEAAELGELSGYASVMLKALGISNCTQLASDVCKDAGETALSSKIEFAGKAALLAVALPLYSELMRGIMGLLA